MDIANIYDLYPENHFGRTYREVIRDVIHGESVGIYAMPGSGVQYFLRFLENELKRKYSMNNVLFFRCSMIRNNIIDVISDRIRSVVGSGSKEDIGEILMSFGKDQKLILIFDGFHYVENVSELLEYLFQLRKTNPGNIVAVISVNYEIFTSLAESLRRHSGAISSLRNLSLFDVAGTKRIIETNNQFFGWEVPIVCSQRIHELSGGNARFVKYISKAVAEEGSDILDDLDMLSKYLVLEYKLSEFTRLLFELDPVTLKKLGIVTKDNRLFSSLLEYSLLHYEMPNLGELVPNLSVNEKRLFSFLFANRGRLVTKDQLEFVLGLVGEKYSMWASYKAMGRLRDKVSGQFVIRSVKGQGYILEVC